MAFDVRLLKLSSEGLFYISYSFPEKKPVLFLLLCIFLSCQQQQADQNRVTKDTPEAHATTATDPLQLWHEGANKQAIVDFVTRVTKEGSPDFIPAEDRIATFDNDGTLWAERPYVQELFAFYRVKKMVEKILRLLRSNRLKPW